MKRLTLLSLFILTLWADAASCQRFRSEDLHRPLVPAWLPPWEAYVQTFSHLEKPEEELKRHRKLLKRKWSIYSVKDRDAWGRGFDIQDLMDAVTTLPEDPYGWHLLGAYYALGHELAAATAANREALKSMELLKKKDPAAAGRFLGDLELRCRANLSLLLTSQDQPTEALDQLGEDFPENAAPVVRHALITAGVLAFAELGEVGPAGELIQRGEHEPAAGDSSEDEGNYPQFGSRWKTQTLPYLRARRNYAAELYPEAVNELLPFDGPAEKARFWEARFLLGLAQWKAGRPKDGAEVIDRLIRDFPEKLFSGRPKGKIQRLELLWYNLGLLHEQMNESPQGDYLNALEVSIDRDCRTFKELRRIDSSAKCSPESVCSALAKQAAFLADELSPREKIAPGCKEICDRVETNPEPAQTLPEKLLCQALAFEPFGAAFNNLGLVYLRRAQETKGSAAASPSPEVLLDKAERVFRTGLEGADTTQHWRLRLNLALVELERSNLDAAVAQIRMLKEESPEHLAEAAALLADALGRKEEFRRNEPALGLFLELATALAAAEMPDYLTSVLEPMASGALGWEHVPAALRQKAAALLPSPEVVEP